MSQPDPSARYRRIVSGQERDPEPSVHQLRARISDYVGSLPTEAPERSPEPSPEEVAADQERIRAETLRENLRRLKESVIVERKADGSLQFRDDKRIVDGGRISG
jgi:hypothetical protein